MTPVSLLHQTTMGGGYSFEGLLTRLIEASLEDTRRR
jgi:hypothetical protein